MNKIRVIKKEEAPAFKIKKRKRSKQRTAAPRDMVATVSDWVSDLKNRKSAEAKAAFDFFNPSNSRPSES